MACLRWPRRLAVHRAVVARIHNRVTTGCVAARQRITVVEGRLAPEVAEVTAAATGTTGFPPVLVRCQGFPVPNRWTVERRTRATTHACCRSRSSPSLLMA